MRPSIFQRFSRLAQLAAVALVIGCDTPAPRVLRAAGAAQVLQQELRVASGDELRLEVRVTAGDVVPSVHLWDPAARQELARARGLGVPLLRTAQLRYRNTSGQPLRAIVLVHGAAADGGGSIDLLRDGRKLVARAPIAGGPLPIASGDDLTYFLAPRPGSPTRATVFAFSRAGRLLASSSGGGPLGLPRLASNAFVRQLLIAAPPSSSMQAGFDVLANDRVDADHDGLGRELEHALGTCDAATDRACAHAALRDYYAKVRHATRDTDRDGLPDGDEVLGVAGTPALELPRWGTDPRHKDVLVEIDRHTPAADAALSEDDLVAVAALFAQGSAAELRNPDGKPGVRLHFDAGIVPRARANATLVGDWGGSNVVELRDYRKARETDLAPARRGYFRYALVSRKGTGQAFRDAFTINRDYHRVQVFAHELAHTLGLAHEGHPRWGKANCKPSYASIMNYVFQNREDVGFSRRGTSVLDPSAVFETRGVPGLPRAALSDPPFELDVIDGGVDWNRDGMISQQPVRAGLLFATYKSCGASTVARLPIARKDAVAARTPALARVGARLFVLWIDRQGRLMQRSGGVSGPDENGSCPRGDGDAAHCMELSEPSLVEGLDSVQQLAATPWSQTQLALSYVRASPGSDARSELHLAWLALDGAQLRVERDRLIDGATTRDAPAVARMATGSSDALAVFYRAADGGGSLWRALALAPDAPFQLQPLRDAHGQAIASAHGPSVLELGTGELCGAFSDRDEYLRFFCLDRARDLWVDLSERAFYAGSGPRTGGPVALAYHRYRDASGVQLGAPELARGAVYLSFTEEAPGTTGPRDNPNLLVSQWLDAEHGALSQIDFRWRGTLDSQWTHLAGQSSVALYEDAQLSALKAVMTHGSGDDLRIELLPLADGAFEAQLGGGSDFEVMERGICTGIRSPAVCGDRSTGAY